MEPPIPNFQTRFSKWRRVDVAERFFTRDCECEGFYATSDWNTAYFYHTIALSGYLAIRQLLGIGPDVLEQFWAPIACDSRLWARRTYARHMM